MTCLINHEFLDRFRGHQGLLDHLVRLYLDTTPDTIRAIESAAGSGDLATVAFHAHSLKGSSSEMGAEQLSELCQQLHLLARHENEQPVEAEVDRVLKCYRETCLELESVLGETAMAS